MTAAIVTTIAVLFSFTFRRAEPVKKKIPFMLFIGEKELNEEIYPLKDVAIESEQKLSLERIVVAVKDYRDGDEL